MNLLVRGFESASEDRVHVHTLAMCRTVLVTTPSKIDPVTNLAAILSPFSTASYTNIRVPARIDFAKVDLAIFFANEAHQVCPGKGHFVNVSGWDFNHEAG